MQDKLVNQKRSHLSPWLIWGLGAAFFFAEYFARVAPSVMVSELMRNFHVTALSLGSLSAFFYYAYVGMQIPVGILVDRYGPHRLLTVTAVLCGLGSLIFGMADNVIMAEVGRFLTGFGAAFAFVGSLKLAAVWFTPRSFGLLAGLTQALGMLGAAVGQAPMSFAVTSFGWRETMVGICGVFLVLAVLIGLIVRDHPIGSPPGPCDLSKGKNVLAGLIEVMKNRQTWFNAMYAGCVYAPMAAFAELWGNTFLESTYGIHINVAASAVMLMFLGWGIGGPIVGWVSDNMQRRKPIMIFSSVMGIIILSTVLYLPGLHLSMIFVLLCLFGLTNTGLAISYAVASEINPRSIAGTSMAFTNMASVIIGAFLQPVIGYFLDKNWDGSIVNGVPVYSGSDFRHALLILPICLVFSLVFACLVKETHCRPVGVSTAA